MSDAQASWQSSGKHVQGGKERLKLLTAITAAVEMVLNQRHGIGNVFTCQSHLHEAVQLLEALVAPDFVGTRGGNPSHQFPQLL